MMAPMPSAIRFTLPSDLFNSFVDCAESAISAANGFLRKKECAMGKRSGKAMNCTGMMDGMDDGKEEHLPRS